MEANDTLLLHDNDDSAAPSEREVGNGAIALPEGALIIDVLLLQEVLFTVFGVSSAWTRVIPSQPICQGEFFSGSLNMAFHKFKMHHIGMGWRCM